MPYCRYPEEFCCNMTLYGGKVYCDDIDGFCHLHDELPPFTNADRIRAMSDEEMADFIYKVAHQLRPPLNVGEVSDWLKQPISDEE